MSIEILTEIEHPQVKDILDNLEMLCKGNKDLEIQVTKFNGTKDGRLKYTFYIPWISYIVLYQNRENILIYHNYVGVINAFRAPKTIKDLREKADLLKIYKANQHKRISKCMYDELVDDKRCEQSELDDIKKGRHWFNKLNRELSKLLLEYTDDKEPVGVS